MVVQKERFIFSDILVIGLREAFLFVRLVGFRTNEFLNLGPLEQTVNVVIVAHKVDRKFAFLLLCAEFVEIV